MKDAVPARLTDLLLGRATNINLLSQVVRLYPPEAIDALLKLGRSLRDPDTRARLLAAIALRDPVSADWAALQEAIESGASASDEARIDVYVALAPRVDSRVLANMLSSLAASIVDPIARERALRSVGADPMERGGQWHWDGPASPKPGGPTIDMADAALVSRLEDQLPAQREPLLKEALGRALDAAAPKASMAIPLDAAEDPLDAAGQAGDTTSEPSGPVMSAPPKRNRAGARPQRRAESVVSTGIARMERPDEPIDRDRGLRVGRKYLFWLEIGEPVAGSIEVKPSGIANALVEQQARLSVILFDADGSRVVDPGMDRGELQLKRDGAATVTVQPSLFRDAAVDPDLLRRRLFFPLRVPKTLGTVSFRCNIYHDGVLIQSRLVRAEVLAARQPGLHALTSTLDYVLTRSLTPSSLSAAAPHELSVMVNESERGTHGFYFATGAKEWKGGADFDTGELAAFLGEARGALRLAAWGSQEPWSSEKAYRYAGAPDRARLSADLIRIAKRGYSFYDAVINRLAGRDRDGETRAPELTALMRSPGSVQVALHDKPRFVLPAALIYDYDLDTGLGSGTAYKICEQFINDLDAGQSLDGSICFKGECPNRVGHFDVVCPSGLWGYRHSIGLPVSLPGGEKRSRAADEASTHAGNGDPPGSIKVSGPLQFSVGISTDPQFTLWKDHQTRMQALRADLSWTVADTRQGTIDLLVGSTPHVVYFYCHGGIANGRPFLQVGPTDDQGIFGDNLRARKVSWKDPRPLVFINGCHTVAVEPEIAHELVTTFMTNARAAGVIGTEITIFEPLAAQFAEAFMRAFINGATVGEAVRTARLDLLQRSNPLGLAYTAYALSNLKLAPGQ